MPKKRATPENGGDSSRRRCFPVSPGEAPCRLDRYLAAQLATEGISREKVKSLILDGKVFVDENPVLSPRFRLSGNEELAVLIPPGQNLLTPEEGELTVLYRDAVLAVINKPAGLTVHPAPNRPQGTLAHRLLAHFPELAAQEGFRPGIVHRLDKDTSGLMLVALTEECRLALARSFARHEVFKEYLALTHGVPDAAAAGCLIEAPISRDSRNKTKMAVQAGGKSAKSLARVLFADLLRRFALVAVRIFSGRTHQVRVHMQHIGHPLLGDAVYRAPKTLSAESGRGKGEAKNRAQDDKNRACPAAPRQMLHAWKLAFAHPLPDKAGPALAKALAATDGPVQAIGAAPISAAAPADNATGGGAPANGAASVSAAAPANGPSENRGCELRFLCPPPEDFQQTALANAHSTLPVVITGSPGCGKSSLLELLRRAGLPVFSADAEVARLYAPGGNGQQLLRAAFGSRFVPDDNSPVDKAALGAAMRDDAALRREVEALIHPQVAYAMQAFFDEQQQARAPFAVAEVPLYLESARAHPAAKMQTPGGSSQITDCAPRTRNEAFFPVLVGVRCPFAIRRERLMARRNWSPELIDLMESWQWPEDKKLAACDLLADNSRGEEDLEAETGLLLQKLQQIRRQRLERTAKTLQALWTSWS